MAPSSGPANEAKWWVHVVNVGPSRVKYGSAPGLFSTSRLISTLIVSICAASECRESESSAAPSPEREKNYKHACTSAHVCQGSVMGPCLYMVFIL